MKEYYADLSAMKLLQVLISVITVILISASIFIFFRLKIIIWILVGIFIITAIIINFICLPVYFKTLKYTVTANQITIRQGIFLVREQSIKLQSVQFVQFITGLNGMFGLNFVILYVYGGSMMIFFMKKQDRQELTDFLQRKGIFHAP
ncbi:MAG: PH domain-containing protein [Oscillospiraceae bacterium]|nr:PH domain-containing protein [Oscillospiraceae bacterium]MDE6004109.1 PH domain-containing protein [Oscillospiraceae bacterium]